MFLQSPREWKIFGAAAALTLLTEYAIRSAVGWARSSKKQEKKEEKKEEPKTGTNG